MDTSLFNSTKYLDLGGALAAFGLIFAIYQLRTPQWKIILSLRSRWQKNLIWIFGGIGLLLTLLGVLLSEFSICWLCSPLDNPLFYEITAYCFFIASPFSLLYLSLRPKGLFNEKTSRIFYEVMVQEISRTNDDGINAALEVLLHNFKDICKAAHEHKNEEINQFARAILNVILSDESVIKILTTKRLDALKIIFAVVENNQISRRESGIGIHKLVQNLFYDKESFLYKHLGGDGLALSSNIYESIFDSPTILTNFDLFGLSSLEYSMRGEMGQLGIEVLIEALSRSIKTYLVTGNVPPRHINNGLSYLSEIFGDICLRISIEEKRSVDTTYSLKDDWLALNYIARWLGHDYPFLAYQEKLNRVVQEREKTASEASFFSDSTINEGIAAALYKAVEQLSYIENTTDTYHTVLDLLNGMMHRDKLKEGYRGPFEKRMWEQIAANIISHYYPATLRTYLEYVGSCLAENQNQRTGWIGEQAERMRRLLYVDLKPLIDSEAKMLNGKRMKDALLPKSMNYKNGKFTYRFGFGRGEEAEITPPLEGEGSALKGVDLDHQSLV